MYKYRKLYPQQFQRGGLGRRLCSLSLLLFGLLLPVSCKKDQISIRRVSSVYNEGRGFISKILFLDDRTGVAVGGSRYAFHEFITTRDGGQSWHTLREEGGDHKALYGLGNWKERIFAVGYEGKVYYADAPYDTWNLVQASNWALFQDLTFTKANRGYMVMGEGYHAGGIVELDTMGQVLRTDSFTFELSCIYFQNAGTGFAGGYGAILKTTDSGRSWELQNAKGDFFKGICASDDHNLWAVGFNGSILHSNDGGANWKKKRNGDNPLLKAYKFRAIAFRDALTGYIAGDKGILLKTTDGGENWSEFERFTDADLRCLTLQANGSVWVGTSTGQLFHIEE
jgi:photosystem II stability/assembly factor-like uncharacterized protein